MTKTLTPWEKKRRPPDITEITVNGLVAFVTAPNRQTIVTFTIIKGRKMFRFKTPWVFPEFEGIS